MARIFDNSKDIREGLETDLLEAADNLRAVTNFASSPRGLFMPLAGCHFLLTRCQPLEGRPRQSS